MTHLRRTSIARTIKRVFPVPAAAAPVPAEALQQLQTLAMYAPYFKSTKPSDGRTGRIFVDLEAGGLKSFV